MSELIVWLVIIGVIYYFKNYYNKNMNQDPRVVNVNSPLQKITRFFKLGISGIILFVVLVIIAFNSFVVINPGEVGVQSLFGKVYEKSLSSGLNFVNPLTKVNKFDIKTQNYTMSQIQDEGLKQGDDAIRVLSSDGLEIAIDVTVLYRVLPEQAPELLKTIGTEYRDTIVRPITRTKIRDAAVYYQAVEMFSVKRDEFQNRVFETIEKDFKDRGLFLEQVLVRNINLPDSVKAAIESKINAEQESQKYEFLLAKEKKEADRKRIEAEGQRDSQKIINESLTDKFLYYQYINQLKDRQGTIYVPTNPANGLPQFNNIGR
jgi:regulator of protease activity HflC (stomatin/prohibitin superfamily)